MSNRCRVLVVDDYADAREMYREYLIAMGFDVVEASNGLEAVSQAVNTAPDVILMDMALPILDGAEATRQLKADSRTAAIPVVALSGYQMARSDAYASCLLKPCLPEHVVRAIRLALAPADPA